MRLMLAALFVAVATPSLADPCEAIPERGSMPAEYRPGSFFAGEVVYVGDGDSLCVQHGTGWAGAVEVRLADFYAPELNEPGGRHARDVLSDLVMGRWVECIAGRRSYDRVIAVCTLDSRSIGQRMREAGVEEGGRGRERA